MIGCQVLTGEVPIWAPITSGELSGASAKIHPEVMFGGLFDVSELADEYGAEQLQKMICNHARVYDKPVAETTIRNHIVAYVERMLLIAYLKGAADGAVTIGAKNAIQE